MNAAAWIVVGYLVALGLALALNHGAHRDKEKEK